MGTLSSTKHALVPNESSRAVSALQNPGQLSETQGAGRPLEYI